MKLYIVGMMICGMLSASMSALAEHEVGRGGGGFQGSEMNRGVEGWRGDRYTVDIWRGGNWVHDQHDGRMGWWWVAAGMWYFYPAPVYPYPDPYTPPLVIVNQQPAAPQAAVQPTLRYWYYCDSAKAYYPYVPSCPEAWRPVLAQPPVPAQAVQPPQSVVVPH